MKYLSDLTVPWVDFLVIVLVGVGVFRGKKRGISGELVDLFMWLSIVCVAGITYEPAADWLCRMLPGYTALAGYITAYLLVTMVLVLMFGSIKRAIGEKILAKDAFGVAEYYLGMCAGAVRFALIIFAGMALLHARLYTSVEVKAKEKQQEDNFGSIRFFRLYSLQADVFKTSYTGRAAEAFLSPFLIKSTAPGGASGQDTVARKREQRINEILAR